jgi:hypothetical protein
MAARYLGPDRIGARCRYVSFRRLRTYGPIGLGPLCANCGHMQCSKRRALVGEAQAFKMSPDWTPLRLRLHIRPACSSTVARYVWRGSSSFATMAASGTRRVHRKGPASAYVRNRGSLRVRKAHLDLLALITGFGELRCTHEGARVVSRASSMHVRGSK